ncbi:MAG TPA: response regulator transcription factor [Chloroflexota bacterium]|nr:response regulator transcription factor [Chloroflexota bacterium]
MLRIVLVDDHSLVREGLAGLLRYQADIEVVGEAADATGALDVVARVRPDLVLMDIDMPGEDGIAATRRLKIAHPEVAVVMLTVHDDVDRLVEAVKAGAQGYLVKNIRSAELLEDLRGVARGEAAISRRMAARLLEEFRRSDEALPTPDTTLTNRELEVLELVAARQSNREIAANLVLSEHTVRNHLKNILGKLHMRSRRQAAAYGIARGWVHPA